MFRLLKKLNKEDATIVRTFLKLYYKIDKTVQDFKTTTGLQCLSECGACCNVTTVEATIAETLPLALYLVYKNRAKYWYNKIYSSGPKGICVFYRPDSVDPKKGRCLVYDFRPPACRLFGFARMRNKYGRPQYVACKAIRAFSPIAYDNTNKLIIQGIYPPIITDFTTRLHNVCTAYERKYIPINTAVRKALEKVLYHFDNNEDKTTPINPARKKAA